MTEHVQRPSDLEFGSSLIEYEQEEVEVDASDIFTEADIDVERLFKEFNCSEIETPRVIVEFESTSTRIQDALNSLIEQIATINKTRNKEKADGSAVSFWGGVLGVGGTVLAPFTLGGSLTLTGLGIAMSLGGCKVSIDAESKLNTELNDSVTDAQSWLTQFNQHITEWTTVAQMLNEIVQELQDIFKDLSFSFSHLVRSVGNVKFEDTSPYRVECILKCASNFYGVVKHSTQVVKDVEQITRLSLKFKQVRTIINTGRKAGELVKVGKGVFLKAAIGKHQTSFSAAKFMVRGKQVISVAHKTARLSQSAKLVKAIKTEKAIRAVGKSVTKRTVTVTKSISRIGLALGAVFALVDLYEMDKALDASEKTCEAEKELRSCTEDIRQSTNEVMAQIETYKQVVRIKAFFQYLLKVDKPVDFGTVEMPIERIRLSVSKIHALCERMT